MLCVLQARNVADWSISQGRQSRWPFRLLVSGIIGRYTGDRCDGFASSTACASGAWCWSRFQFPFKTFPRPTHFFSDMPMPKPETAWNAAAPALDECCICGTRVQQTQRVVQQRQTGRSGRAQTWVYCQACAPQKRELDVQGSLWNSTLSGSLMDIRRFRR